MPENNEEDSSCELVQQEVEKDKNFKEPIFYEQSASTRIEGISPFRVPSLEYYPI
jgi:hypothetical protein